MINQYFKQNISKRSFLKLLICVLIFPTTSFSKIESYKSKIIWITSPDDFR